MTFLDCVQASWRKASGRCGALAFAALVALSSHGALAQSFTLTLQPNTLPAATQGTAYTQVITAVGGFAPYTFAITGGALPTGLTLAPDGTLSGTATATGSFSFTVTATDSGSNTGFRVYNSFQVGTPGLLTLNPPALPNGSQGIAYNQTVTATGGSGGYVYSISAGSLPPGLALNPSTGAITGTPTTGGAYSFTVFSRDSNGNTGTQAYSVNIGTASLTVSPTTLSNGTVGVAYSQTVSASGGTGPYTFAVSAGALPGGLSLDTNTGAITGTPSGTGTSNFTIRATDSLNNTGTRAYTVIIGANVLTLNPVSLPAATQGNAYSQTVVATGGTTPYSYSVSAGALPAGLTLNTSSGAITGTPSASGVANFTITATDPSFNTGSRAYSITVNPPPLNISPTSLPAATQGVAYSQTVTASGGVAPYSYVVLSGALPTGLSLNASSGAITGTPTAGGTFNFTIQATDSTPNTGTRSYTINVGTSSLTVNPASLPSGTQTVAYSQTVSATGGTGPYTFAVSAGALPTGLALNPSSGAITGTPSAGGSFNFTIRATDTLNNFGTRAYTVNIGATGTLTVTPASLPPGSTGVAYSQTVGATGGTGPYTFAVSAGALPAGLALNPTTGAITGTPSAGGTANFTVQATDTLGNTGNRPYALTIGTSTLTLAPSILPAGTQSVAYSQSVTASGGTGPYTYAVISGALPAGLTLNSSNGLISGTPTTGGTANFTIRATDANGNTGSSIYALNIGTNSLTVNPATLPAGTQGTAYSQTATATGGTGPYTFSITSGALPAGLTLNTSSGAITGTPTAGGTANFTIRAIDNNGNTGSRPYTVSIGTSTLTVSPASLPAGTQGTAYSQSVTAAGGTAPYVYAIISGALPAGLTLNTSSGAITGTPTANGTFNFTVQATDTNGNTGSRPYTLSIGSSTLTVNPTTLPAATQGQPYSRTVSATGGTAPYTYAVTAGTLPAGLALNPGSGVISGTPTGTGLSNFSVQATDANGNTGTRAFAVSVGTSSLTVGPSSLPPSVQGQSYRATVTAAGGTAPYTFSVLSGALPPGLTLNTATGVISGTPTAGAAAAFVIQALDANGNTGTQAFALTSRPDPAADPDVRGLVNAQAQTARRFATTQIDNVMRHLEGLHHRFDPCSFSFGLAPPVDPPSPNDALAQAQPPAQQPYYRAPGALAQAPNTPAAQVVQRSPNCADTTGAMAFWVGGAMQFGSMTPGGLTADNRFTTSGITAGVDVKVAQNLIFGVAVGYATDRTDIGSNGTRSDAKSFNGALYASFKPVEPWFIDVTLGYGTLGYDNRRFVTTGGVAAGARTGSYWFGGAAVSVELKADALKFAPYVRADFVSVSLKEYGEDGPGAQALVFGAAKMHSMTAAIGLRGSYDIKMGWGVLTPNARIEYRRIMDGAFDQSMYYSDLGPSMMSVLNQASLSNGSVNTTLGLRATAAGGLSVELEYGLSMLSSALQVYTLRGIVRVPF